MAKKEKPATTQAEYDKAYEEVKSGKQPVPSFDDMGPLPDTNKAKGIELKLGPSKKDKMTDLNPVAKKKGGMVKKYSKGGTASSRADGIATKGKTRGKIC